MKIRSCKIEDTDLLVRVLLQSYRENYLYLWLDGGESYIRTNFSAERLNEELSDPNAAFFLVYDEEKPVGVIKLNISKSISGFPAEAALELERIYFIKEASGKGLGRESISFILDFARENNKSVVWLKAMDSSAAIEFYKKRGFQIVGETWLGYQAMKEEYRRMVIMVLKLF